jgi:uncharacterized iron-regulated protein
MRRALGGLALAAATWLAACQHPAPLALPGQHAAALVAQGERYQLDMPLVDLYDTAFVLSSPTPGAGAAAPRSVGLEALADALLAYDVVFYGELHRHPGVHLQQQRLLRALHARDARWIVSLEQFERDVQPVLDDYLAGRIGEITLVEQGRAWDNYRTSYRPLLEFAKQQGLPVVAAEAPVWAIACIGQWGPGILQQFSPSERGWVARDLHLQPGPYRDKYARFQSGSATHGGGAQPDAQARQRADNSFAGQVARDDTMAESIDIALRLHPGRRLLHLNGSFHSAAFLGTVERLKLRQPALRIAVITPVEVDDARRPWFPASALAEGTALQLVQANPADFADGEDPSAWVRKIIAQRLAKPCKYTPPAASAPAAPAASTPGGQA